MFDFFNKSLKNRLFTILVGIGLLPFITLLIYIMYLSETKLVNQIVLEQFEQTNTAIKRIDDHINSLRKEVSFLSSLDLMDDILADDIDKRISRLLTKKADDLNIDITFLVLTCNSSVIASSDKKYLQKNLSLNIQSSSKNSFFLDKNTLYINSNIYASFDKNKELGHLVLKYNLQNLSSYLPNSNGVNSYIVNKHKKLIVGDETPLLDKFIKKSNTFIDDNYVVVYKEMLSVLDDFYFVYAVDKNIALEFLYDFTSFMFYMSVLIFIFIIYISLKQSKNIIKPIEELTQLTKNITTTHNYSSRLLTNSQDEIAILTKSFNQMIETTSKALNDLEKENKLLKKTMSASDAKSAFISNMSHELRTPLNAIIGFSQYLITYEDLSDDQVDTVANIESSALYLLNMINEILDIAKIEAGKMIAYKQDVDILSVLQNSYDMLSPLAYDKELEFEFISNNYKLESFNTDPKMFQQIVVNLISNAIKFTQVGTITLEVYNTNETLFVCVKDTGVGIAQEDMKKLFKDFIQLNNDLQIENKGTGLGLSLSKKMAKILGGTIEIQSQGVREGTKAIFKI